MAQVEQFLRRRILSNESEVSAIEWFLSMAANNSPEYAIECARIYRDDLAKEVESDYIALTRRQVGQPDTALRL